MHCRHHLGALAGCVPYAGAQVADPPSQLSGKGQRKHIRNRILAWDVLAIYPSHVVGGLHDLPPCVG